MYLSSRSTGARDSVLHGGSPRDLFSPFKLRRVSFPDALLLTGRMWSEKRSFLGAHVPLLSLSITGLLPREGLDACLCTQEGLWTVVWWRLEGLVGASCFQALLKEESLPHWRRICDWIVISGVLLVLAAGPYCTLRTACVGQMVASDAVGAATTVCL